MLGELLQVIPLRILSLLIISRPTLSGGGAAAAAVTSTGAGRRSWVVGTIPESAGAPV